MQKRILIYLNVLMMAPLIIGDEGSKCCGAVPEIFNICIKDNVLSYVNNTGQEYHGSLFIEGCHQSGFTSIAPNALQNLSVNEIIIGVWGRPLTIEPQSFAGLQLITKLSILGATTSLDENIFGAIPSLTSLSFISCKFGKIKGGAFTGLPNLKTLLITHSNIPVINNDTFYGANHISKLNLEQSLISNLKPNSLAIFPNLTWLSLKLNAFTNIKPGVFNGLDELQHLDLGSNEIRTIRKGVFNRLGKVRTILLTNNLIKVICPGAFDGRSLDILDLQCNPLRVIKRKMFSGASIRELRLGCNDNLVIAKNAFRDTSVMKISFRGPNRPRNEKQWGLGNTTVEFSKDSGSCFWNSPSN